MVYTSVILLAAECSLLSKDFQILCVPWGRIDGRTCGYKWSLLKVREGKYEREHGGAQVESGGRGACVSSPGDFKIYTNLCEEIIGWEPGNSHPIINEGGP
jgi:hypothetical protein